MSYFRFVHILCLRFVLLLFSVVRGKLARIDFDFLQTSRKQEDRNVGNLLVSVSFIFYF